MTPTLKEQIEQWIEREADKYQKEYRSNLNLKLRIYSDIRDANKAGAHSILPMLLVALQGLELVKHESIYVGENGWKDEYFLSVKSATEALNKMKSMMEGKGND